MPVCSNKRWLVVAAMVTFVAQFLRRVLRFFSMQLHFGFSLLSFSTFLRHLFLLLSLRRRFLGLQLSKY